MVRLLPAIGAVVFVITTTLFIFDHAQKKRNPSTVVVDADQASTPAAPRKTPAARTRKARMAVGEATDVSKAQVAADHPHFVHAEFLDSASPDQDEAEAATERNKLRDTVKTPAPQCLPLPNGTQPGDVDAAYYKDWAKEYSCVIP